MDGGFAFGVDGSMDAKLGWNEWRDPKKVLSTAKSAIADLGVIPDTIALFNYQELVVLLPSHNGYI